MGGWTYLGQTHKGNLAVGISTEPFITVYGPDGSKLFEFSLMGDPVPVTKSLIRRYKEIQLSDMKKDPELQKGYWKDSIKELERASFDHLFDDSLPRYHELLVDEEGNFLLFRSGDCFVDCPIILEVYTPEGVYVYETEIKTGDYDLIVDKRREHMCFTKSGLVALVQPKVDLEKDDFHLKMMWCLNQWSDYSRASWIFRAKSISFIFCRLICPIDLIILFSTSMVLI
jgi:hypothetical protein